MSNTTMYQIACDGEDCDDVIDSPVSYADVRYIAKESGWKIGRGRSPDLCPTCKSKQETERGE